MSLFSNVDDAAALLLASTLPCANLLAVQINYPSSYTVLTASAILTYYSHPNLLIGAIRPFDVYYYQYEDCKIQRLWNSYLTDMMTRGIL